MTASDNKDQTFSDFERNAIKQRALELKAAAKADKDRSVGEAMLLEKIAEMEESDKSMAKKIHEIVTANAPDLFPKTWYGMPAYAKDGKVVCFFQGAKKFEARYATFGFNDTAKLDDGEMWPISFALKKLTAAEEKKIAELVKKAIG